MSNDDGGVSLPMTLDVKPCTMINERTSGIGLTHYAIATWYVILNLYITLTLIITNVVFQLEIIMASHKNTIYLSLIYVILDYIRWVGKESSGYPENDTGGHE